MSLWIVLVCSLLSGLIGGSAITFAIYDNWASKRFNRMLSEFDEKIKTLTDIVKEDDSNV